MNKLQKSFIRFYMGLILRTLAFSARRTSLNQLTSGLSSFLSNTVIRNKRIKKATDLIELGKMWQKGFPSAKQVPLTLIDENTVFAEIHTPCPLRGTGNTSACWRMMEFDRKIVAKAGGKFVVLESQATQGNTFCKVAMRFENENMDDLKEAHLN